MLASTSCATLLAAPAFAQDSAPPPMNVAATAQDSAPPDTAAVDGQIQEVVVTAQKRRENVQHVPISIQALDSTNLEQHQVADFDDYAKELPSVSFQSFGPGQSQLFFRGITSGGDGLPFGALPTSGEYLDEIPVTTVGALLDIHVYDVARIEALSGPQGTLYGASSLSGTLRIITNKPDPDKFSAAVNVEAGKYGGGGAGGGTLEGYVNVPFNQHTALRAVGYVEHDGGYIDNTPFTRTYERPHPDENGDTVFSPLEVSNAPYVKNNFNDVDTYGGRLALGIDLDDNWTITPQLIGQFQQTHGSFLYDPRLGGLQVHDFTPEFNRDGWYQAALTVKGKVFDWDALYSGGYLGRRIHNASDYSYYTVAYEQLYPQYNTDFFQTASGQNIDPTQHFTGAQDLTKQTHELRFTSPAGKRLRGTAGLFYQRQTNNAFLNYFVPGLSQNVVTSWWDAPPVYGDSIFLTDTTIIDRDYAAFAEASFDITSKLTFTAGIRGFRYDNVLEGFSGFSFNAPATCVVPFPSLGSCSNLDKSASGSGQTHKLNLTYQFDRDRMAYFTYSTGFRPGGNNRRASVNPYGPDTLDNYEFGWKTSWLNRRLRVNGAVYHEDWNNLQYALVVEGSGGVTNIYNAGNASVNGTEFDIQVIPVRRLTLSASGAYNDAKLKTNFCAIGADGNPDCSAGNVAAPSGTRLPVQPRFKITGTARYEFWLGDVESFVQGTVLDQTSNRSFLGDADNTAVGGNSPGFSTVDFSVGGKLNKSSLELYVQNAFDERGQLTHNVFTAPASSGQYYRVYPVKPQYFGVRFSQSF
jgi:outer membrane receptor protein involved in Fe transport